MPRGAKATEPEPTWTPISDVEGRFSTGTADFDRLLGGGFARGSMALFHLDDTVGPSDWRALLTPTLLNFLYQSRGVMAVLPSRDSPRGFRAEMTQWVSRRRFDTRVRVIDYVGEDDETPYVVSLRRTGGGPPGPAREERARLKKDMDKMVAAEKAVQGARARVFLELIAFEIMDMVVGSERAARMFFHGVKRSRLVGNLCVGLLRPGLGCAEAVRGMADVEFALHRGEMGLTVRGVRPGFTSHLVVPDPASGTPHVRFVPAP